jgi:ribose 5-phosphate isomerase A
VTDAETLKRAAGIEAAGLVEAGMRIGLGTGSTVAHFLLFLSERINRGGLRNVLGVPTSLWTAQRARDLGIPLTSLAEHPFLDLTVDGADEVDPNMDLIKGLGSALLREKMVAQASSRLAIIADDGKVVDRLGQISPVPVEVVQFGWEVHENFLQAQGARPVIRQRDDGQPLTTDNGNYIIDCHFPDGIADPQALDAALAARAGIVESGLFIGMATEVIIGAQDGVRHSFRKGQES